MLKISIAIFVIIFVVGLIGTIWVYAQPSASNWDVVYIFMLIIGFIGFLVTFIIFFATGG